MRVFFVWLCVVLAVIGSIWEGIMTPEIMSSWVAGASLALAFTFIGLVIGIFVGIKLEDRFDLDSGGTNYRRRKG